MTPRVSDIRTHCHQRLGGLAQTFDTKHAEIFNLLAREAHIHETLLYFVDASFLYLSTMLWFVRLSLGICSGVHLSMARLSTMVSLLASVSHRIVVLLVWPQQATMEIASWWTPLRSRLVKHIVNGIAIFVSIGSWRLDRN